MQALLEDLNSLPGVIGSAFCDAHEGVLGRAFPAEYDDAALAAVARALSSATPSLRSVTGSLGVLDLRFREGRVVVRPAGDAALLVLCDKTANAQEVLAFASVACKKFERLRQPGAATLEHPAPAPKAALPAPAASGTAEKGQKGKRPAYQWLLLSLALLLAVAGIGGGALYGYRALKEARAPHGPVTPPAVAAAPVEPIQPPAAVAPAEVRLRLAGADALSGELLPRLVAAYLRSQKVLDVEVNPGEGEVTRVLGTQGGARVGGEVARGGTARGLNDLLAGSVDVAVATRRIWPEERQRLAVLGTMTSPANEHVVALDGVAVIVNRANAVKALTREQLARLLSGAATDWSQFGLSGEEEWSAVGVAGKGGPVASGVHVYLPEEGSGVTELVQGAVMGQKLFAKDARRLATVQEVADLVAGDPGGLGVVPMQAANGTRPVPISDLEDPPLLPTPFTVASEDYLLTHRLYLYTAQASQNPQVARFVEFALSAEGQAEVRRAGLVELSVKAESPAMPAGAPPEYVRLTSGARRLSTTFRFEAGASAFDSRAQRDLDRVVDYLRQNDLVGSAVRLLGFADQSGAKATNQQLSFERATLLAQALAQRGISGVTVAGLGPALPVADNGTEDGRRRNRRVEVWVAR